MTNFESPKDLELFHYGVKGMKWGVTRALKDTRNATINKAVERQGQLEAKGNAAFKQETAKNRAAGQGRIKARRNALNSKAVTKYDQAVEREDSKIQKANQQYKLDKQKAKTNKAADRTRMREGSKNSFQSVSKGRLAAEALLTSGASVGYRSARGAGADKGEALAAGLLGGPLGGVGYRRLNAKA